MSMRLNMRLYERTFVRRRESMKNENDIDCEQEERTFVRRVATAETGNLVPLGPPRSRYLCRGRSISIWIDRNCQKESKSAEEGAILESGSQLSGPEFSSHRCLEQFYTSLLRHLSIVTWQK